MKKIIIAFSLLFLATSCVETVVVGSLAGVVVVSREKSFRDTGGDIVIAAKIDKELLVGGLKGVSNSVGVMVDEGRVLLTGVIRDAQKGQLAIDIAWKVDGVKEVIDELEVNKEGVKARDFSATFSDSYITSAIKTKLFFRPSLAPANYKITTFNQTVFVLGVYREDSDIKGVLNLISKTYGVKKVINYAISTNDIRRKSTQ